jgi:L-alanine-DL-glutamate epimerase-like enolase superfamily enzyme
MTERPYSLALEQGEPVIIESIDVLTIGGLVFARVGSTGGIEGLVQMQKRTRLALPILKEWVVPYFLGRDAREIEQLEDDFYYSARHYKLSGMPLWKAFAAVELATLDLLGKVEGKPVAALFGEMTRTRVPVYASRFERDVPVDESVARLERDLALYGGGVGAVKLKIGGRMSRDADAFPGRTEAYVAAVRKLLGDGWTIYVDANGSYGAAKGIEVGHMLQEYGVAMYEEPCPFEDYESTRQVTAGVDLPVSGGEQDWSQWAWERMARERIVDILQPDFENCGGFIRALKVAALAEAGGMPVTPHSPIEGPASAIKAQFASLVPNAGVYQEHRARKPVGDWYAPQFTVDEQGTIPVPDGPGWGITYDPGLLDHAETL